VYGKKFSTDVQRDQYVTDPRNLPLQAEKCRSREMGVRLYFKPVPAEDLTTCCRIYVTITALEPI